MAHFGEKVRRLSRRPRALTTGAQVARILGQISRAPPSGTGVLTLTESGELYQGRRLPGAFVWLPANEDAYAAFKLYRARVRRGREAA